MAAAAAIKVLHLINGEFYAGAERVQDLLALQLASRGFAVSFACLKDGTFAARRRAQQAPLYPMPMRSRFDFALCLRLAKLVRAEKFQLLHTHTPRSALIGRVVSTLTGLPMIHHVHSPAELDTEQGWRNVRNGLVEKFSLRGASRLIVVSSSLEERLRERGFPAARICQIPNGVPVTERSRRSYQPGQPLTIGMIALYRPRKGVEVLLEAMKRLRDAGVQIRLRAIGPFETPEYQRAVLELASKLGLEQAIAWVGFTSDISGEFKMMHLFVLPSLYGEGMPMVVLEAMAAGLPIVSTRVEGIPQVVRHGVDGLLATPGDATDIADAMKQFVRGDVSSELMGDSGWHRQRENFSDVSMAAGVAAVYEQVLRA